MTVKSRKGSPSFSLKESIEKEKEKQQLLLSLLDSPLPFPRPSTVRKLRSIRKIPIHQEIMK